jgi:CcmD family protein
MMRRLLIVTSCLLGVAAPLLAWQQAPAGQEGFVPVTELPAAQQLPAAPFLIAAYAFIWVALMVYLWSIWRRLGKVEQEIHSLEQRSSRGGSR